MFTMTNPQFFFILGPRRSSIEFGCSSHGGTGLPKFYQNQHILMGQNKKTQFQEEKIPDQITSRRICKFHYCLVNLLELPH